MADPTNGAGTQSAASGPDGDRTVVKAAATKAPTEATELLRTDSGNVAAAVVTMERSGAERITGERVNLNRSGAKTIEARSVQMDRSGVVGLASEHTVLHDGSAVVVKAKEARIVKSRVLLLVADQAHVDSDSRVLVRIGGIRSAGLLAAGGSALLAVVSILLGRLLLERRRS